MQSVYGEIQLVSIAYWSASSRDNLIETATFKRRTKSYQDIVREDSIPALFNFFGRLFRSPDVSRKLKPMRNQQRAKAFLHSRHKIVINIQSATNLPEKINGEPTNIFVDILFRVSEWMGQEFNRSIETTSTNNRCWG